MAELQIRKKSATVWEHIKEGVTIILSNGTFRLTDDNFELTELSGVDQFAERQTALTDIKLYDDTDASSEETFTSSVTFVNRLKALGYPFFRSASGSDATGEFLSWFFTGEDTDFTVTTDQGVITSPNYSITATGVAVISNKEAPTGSSAIFDLNKGGTTMLSTKVTIEAGNKNSEDSATQPVFSTTAISANSTLSVDTDQIGSTVAGGGGQIILYYERT